MARERKYEVPEADERDYPADFAEVKAGGGTPMHAHFGEWTAEKTGASFSTAKELAAFKLGAQFGIRYRMNYQRAADGAHAFHAEQQEAREAAAGEKAQRATARKTKAEPVAEAPAPKRRGRPARAAAAEVAEPTAKATATGRPARRPAAAGKPGRPARKGAGGTEPAF